MWRNVFGYGVKHRMKRENVSTPYIACLHGRSIVQKYRSRRMKHVQDEGRVDSAEFCLLIYRDYSYRETQV